MERASEPAISGERECVWQLQAMYPALGTAKDHKALSELQEIGAHLW